MCNKKKIKEVEQRLMSQEEFEGLWQEAEFEAHARKLVSGYAPWKRRQRWIAVGVTTCLVGAIADAAATEDVR